MMKLISHVDPLQRRARRGLFSAVHIAGSWYCQRHVIKQTLRMQACQLFFSTKNSLLGIQIAVHVVPVPSAFTPLQPGVGHWLVWKSVPLAGAFPKGPWMPLTWSSMQIYPLNLAKHIPCIGIPVSQEDWQYATVKQRSAIHLPKIALSQKRQCCFCWYVLNQPIYYFRARAIIQ